MSVTFRQNVTSRPVTFSQRTRTSKLTPERMCPMCGGAWTVAPHRYRPALPGVTGRNSRTARVAVSYRRSVIRQGYGIAGRPRACPPRGVTVPHHDHGGLAGLCVVDPVAVATALAGGPRRPGTNPERRPGPPEHRCGRDVRLSPAPRTSLWLRCSPAHIAATSMSPLKRPGEHRCGNDVHAPRRHPGLTFRGSTCELCGATTRDI